MNDRHFSICIKKVTYTKRSAAKRIAKKMKEKYGKEFIIYKCPYCKHMHLSTYREEYDYFYKDREKGGRVVYSTNGEY